MTSHARQWALPRAAQMLLVVIALATAVPALAAAQPVSTGSKSERNARANALLANVPMAFERNRGQSAAEVDFLTRGSVYNLFLSNGKAVFAFADRPESSASAKSACSLRLAFVGARASSSAVGEQLQVGRSNYINLDGSAATIGEVERYARVRYTQLLSGVDLVFYGNEGRLEYDLELAPGATAHPPVLTLEGADGVSLAADGALAIDACDSHVSFEPPIAYQTIDGQRAPVNVAYRLLADNRATFVVGEHDPRLPLVIDPVFAYSTCIAGSDDDGATDIAIGPSGETYIVGYTSSADFPVRNPIHGYGGGYEGFVTKLNAAGTDIIFSTYVGNNPDNQIINGVAINSAGEPYITGYTGEFLHEAFLLKLNASGSAVLFSSVFGGSGDDVATRVVVDASGNADVVGSTSSSDFPTLNPLQANYGQGGDAFLRRYSSTGTLLTSTYLGGANTQSASAVALGADNSIYIGGTSGTFDQNGDAFVLKLNSTASAVVYSRTFGGSNVEEVAGLEVDGTGRAHLAGSTKSANFPTANAMQPSYGGGSFDGFLTVLDASGANFVTSTYLGGSDRELVTGVALGPDGSVFLISNESQFTSLYLTKLGPPFQSVVYKALVGGQSSSYLGGIRVSGSGAVYISGRTGSHYSTTQGSFQSCPLTSFSNAFASKIIDGSATISISDTTVVEGNNGSTFAHFTVSTNAPPLQTISADFVTADGSATQPVDYLGANGIVDLDARTLSKVIDIEIIGDTLDEPNETFQVNLANAQNATLADAQGIGTIIDDDPVPTISISDCSVTEGNTGTVLCGMTASLSTASGQTVTVSYATANATAVAPGDYTANSGALTFTPGQISKPINISVIGDTLDEVNETFVVNLTAPLNATISDAQGVGTIIDDDPAPSISISDCSVTEGNASTVQCAMTASLSTASGQTVTVSYATANVTAIAPGDYTASSGMLTFSPGQISKPINISVIGDTINESNETFVVNLSAPANATIADGQGVGTIVNDDQPNGALRMTECAAEISELLTQIQLTVERVNGSWGSVSVSYATANGSALAGSDYTTTSGVLNWTGGDSGVRTITVPLINNPATESREDFRVNLAMPGGGATSIAPSSSHVWILDNPDQILDDGFGGMLPCN